MMYRIKIDVINSYISTIDYKLYLQFTFPFHSLRDIRNNFGSCPEKNSVASFSECAKEAARYIRLLKATNLEKQRKELNSKSFFSMKRSVLLTPVPTDILAMCLHIEKLWFQI